jgi:hypothetical protein
MSADKSGGAEVVELSPGGKVRFSSANAAEMARRSHAKRRENHQRRALAAKELRALAEAQMIHLPAREEFAELAAAGVGQMLLRIVSGDLQPRTLTEAVTVAKVLLDIARLEGGEATVITGTMTREQILAGVRELQTSVESRRVGRMTGGGVASDDE